MLSDGRLEKGFGVYAFKEYSMMALTVISQKKKENPS